MIIAMTVSGQPAHKLELNLTLNQIKNIKKYLGYTKESEIANMFTRAAQSLYSDLRRTNLYPFISYLQVKQSFEAWIEEKLSGLFEIFEAVGIQPEDHVIDIVKMVFGLEAAVDEKEFIEKMVLPNSGAANENSNSAGV